MHQKLTAQHGFIPLLISLLVLGILSLSIFYIVNKGVQQKQYHPTKAQTSPSITPPKSVPDQLLVAFKPDASEDEKNGIRSAHGVSKVGEISRLDTEILNVPAEARDRVLEALKHNPKVDHASLDYYLDLLQSSPTTFPSPTTSPNDPLYLYPGQWALKAINAPVGWNSSTGWNGSTGKGVTIAFIDSGITLAAPEFTGRIVSGYSYVNADTTDVSDEWGHGTMTAGIAAAATNNQEGIAGVAYESLLMPVKVVNASGSAKVSDMANGILYAAEHGAKVINVPLGSVGGESYDMVDAHNAIKCALTQGSLVVVAAGNYGTLYPNYPVYPGSYDESFTVSGTKGDNTLWTDSTFGPQVDVAAPANLITTTYKNAIPQNYSLTPAPYTTYATGTSMAAPHVSALAALLFAKNPSLIPWDVRHIIEQTAQDLGATGRDDYFGWGLIDVTKAMSSLASYTPTSPQDPIIQNIQSYPSTYSTVSIQWSTVSDSTSQVKYWVTPKQKNTVPAPMFMPAKYNCIPTKNHVVGISNLNTNTSYSYQVLSRDITGKEYSSPVQTFIIKRH